MNDKRLDKVTEAIRVKFPEASTEAVREFAMALIDYGQRIRKQSKVSHSRGKRLKYYLGKEASDERADR